MHPIKKAKKEQKQADRKEADMHCAPRRKIHANLLGALAALCRRGECVGWGQVDTSAGARRHRALGAALSVNKKIISPLY